MKNKNLLIGFGVVVAGYLLYIKSQKDEFNKRVRNMEAIKQRENLWEA